MFQGTLIISTVNMYFGKNYCIINFLKSVIKFFNGNINFINDVSMTTRVV